MFRKVFVATCLSVGLGAFSSIASAAFIGTFPGNDCSGLFGQGFENCKIPADIDPNESPIIIKFNIGGETEINSDLFPTIDGSEFAFTGTGGSSGTWTYTPGAGDPTINFFVAKGGPDFNLFNTLAPDSPLFGNWFTPGGAGLSHIDFYDTDGGGQVPEPATLLLLGAGLFAAGFARRRIKRD
jgi:hypothetical protein